MLYYIQVTRDYLQQTGEHSVIGTAELTTIILILNFTDDRACAHVGTTTLHIPASKSYGFDDRNSRCTVELKLKTHVLRWTLRY